MNTPFHRGLRVLATLGLMAAACAQAQTTIDQNKALAGSVTPGDAAGFPVTLSIPGAYKLTGNLLVPASTTGILIAANNVTLDLNGFSIIGPVVCTGLGAALTCPSPNNLGRGVSYYNGMTGTTLRNGTVRGFASNGVELDQEATIDGVTARSNRGFGLAANANSRVSNSLAIDNGSSGIYLSSGGLIIGSQAINNKEDGLVLGGFDSAESPEGGGEVRDSFASGNGAVGIASYQTPGSFIGNNVSKNGACFNAGVRVRNNGCNGALAN